MNLLICCLQTLNFWDRNEGTFLGSFGAGIVAIIAYFLSQYSIRKKEKYKYEGLLYTAHVELDEHKHHFKLLKNTLAKLKNVSVQKGTFVLKNAPTQFNLSVLETILLQTIEYKKYNHEVVAVLTSYLNQIRNINYLLDFRNAGLTLNLLDNKKDRINAIEDYFNHLDSEYINKTRPSISTIRLFIEKDLKNYSKAKLVNPES
jgi:hypothetical protein